MRDIVADDAALAVHRRVNGTGDAPLPGDPGSGRPDAGTSDGPTVAGGASVKELFERCAARSPDAPAVADGERTVSYRALNRHANALAARLRAAGVLPGATVGVCAARSPGLVAALIAILKCGAAYVPVDASWPDERLRVLLELTGSQVLLSDRPEHLARRLPSLRVEPVGDAEEAGSTGTAVDAGATEVAAEHEANPPLRVAPDALAYINLTSGSTGTPKAVPVPHRGVVRLVSEARYAPLGPDAAVLHLAPLTFDAATFELWGPLLNGGTCVLYPPGLIRLSVLRRVIARHGVSALFLTTSLFNTVVDEAPDVLDPVRTILTGGEAHSLPHMAASLRRYGPGRVVDCYGPTECTTFAVHHELRELPPDGAPLPIGWPIQHTRVYVLDGERLCGPGETGEVLLAGPGLANGYLGQPDVTRARFHSLRVEGLTVGAERVYRTGDLGSLREDGALFFQGRADDQVKIRGHRIEPGEIVHHLDQHENVKRSFVTAVRRDAGERELVAFVVPANAHANANPNAHPNAHGTGEAGDEAREAADLRAYLATRLPPYLVPTHLVACAELPLTAHGKVDRDALLALPHLSEGGAAERSDR